MINVAEGIPYRSFKHRLFIVDQELKKNRYVEVCDKYVYSAVKKSSIREQEIEGGSYSTEQDN